MSSPVADIGAYQRAGVSAAAAGRVDVTSNWAGNTSHVLNRMFTGQIIIELTQRLLASIDRG